MKEQTEQPIRHEHDMKKQCGIEQEQEVFDPHATRA